MDGKLNDTRKCFETAIHPFMAAGELPEDQHEAACQ